MSREGWLDDRSAQGLCFFTQWIKQRAAELNAELEELRHAAEGVVTQRAV